MSGKPDLRDPRIHRSLLRWFDENRRPMPWREEPSPYRVWISEIMLQQTQVATVIPYFERFVRRFPDLSALAEAEEEELLALWSGLGYYRRARNLHRAAAGLVAEHGGCFPEDARSLAALPGVGEYTAGAIASIAFGAAEPSIDGNQIRVLTRLESLDGDPARQPLRGRLRERARELLALGHPGDLNQALMELGSMVCKPCDPSCGTCPLAADCRAYERGEAESFPRSAAREAVLDLSLEVGLFRRGERILLARGERPFLSGLWNLPFRIEDGAGRFAAEAWSDLGLSPGRLKDVGEDSVTVTRHRIRRRTVTGTVKLRAGEKPVEYRWVGRDQLGRLGLPAFARRLLDRHLPQKKAGSEEPA